MQFFLKINDFLPVWHISFFVSDQAKNKRMKKGNIRGAGK